MVYSGSRSGDRLFNFPAKNMYYIDFGSSRTIRPGEVIEDFKKVPRRLNPPEGLVSVDPYAYDIYMLGCTLKCFLEVGITNVSSRRVADVSLVS